MRRVSRSIAAEARRGYARVVGRRAVAVELAAVVVALILFEAYNNLLDLVARAARTAGSSLSYVHRSTVAMAAHELLLLAGVVVLAVGYARYRGLSLSASLPAREDAGLVGAAAGAAAALSLLLMGYATVITGPSAGSIASALLSAEVVSKGLSSALDPQLGLELLLVVPTTALLFHGFVQNAFGRVLDRDAALVLTVGVVGFLLISSGDLGVGRSAIGYALQPDAVVAIGIVLSAVGAAAYANHEAVPDKLRRAATALPLVAALAVAALMVASATDAVTMLSWDGDDLVFNLIRLTVLGIAAYAYDRTESLVAPALTYASFALAYTVVTWIHLTALLSL